jgi:ATP-dependent DNA helicase RecQ
VWKGCSIAHRRPAEENTRAKTSSDVENKYNEHLFEELRKNGRNWPMSRIFHPMSFFPDTTLMEMSYYYPQDEDKLMGIYGVGSSK